ncbi:MAG: division/cell wall cluster transcriptional repressor MraZ, partial [Bacteroidales bacterium]|nr:division/cell wall cluster transcriptional repressor MraZ [Bacteroidales bacterium]
PKNLIASVSLNKEIVFVGMGNRIEIWDKAYYDELQMTENDLDLDELLNPTKNNTTKEE